MLKLHFAPHSRAGRIVWLLEELGLPYEINKMDFHPKALKSDEHRSRHPLGTVPVLDDGDTRLIESGAIVEYILERHKNGGLKPEPSAPEFPAASRADGPAGEVAPTNPLHSTKRTCIISSFAR